jgi:RNA polymerase-binding transcription factor DksA
MTSSDLRSTDVDVNAYRERLVELEASLSKHLKRDLDSGREQLVDTAADAGDQSIADESESEDFTEAELDTTTLQQVQAALHRIQNGTYGQCLIDGGQLIRSATTQCRARRSTRHQKLLEAASSPKPTL